MLFGDSPSDFGYLPPQFKGDVQMFLPQSTTTTTWQQWIKPRGATMVYMLCVGGGGGGGFGFAGLSNTARGGGGGGGSGAINSLILPAVFLPDVLKVSAGSGGIGGNSPTGGSSGVASYVSMGNGLTLGTATPNTILRANGGGPGGSGSATAGGTAGAGAGLTTNFTHGIGLGLFNNIGGLAGVAGGAHTGAAGNPQNGVLLSLTIGGGAGGGGINTPAQAGFAGGAINLTSSLDFADGTLTPSSGFRSGGVAGTIATPGGNGNAGVESLKPFVNTGGSGGGSCDNGAGGNGGQGGYGCGGGGGGAGTVSGRGGNGGEGLVLIISW